MIEDVAEGAGGDCGSAGSGHSDVGCPDADRPVYGWAERQQRVYSVEKLLNGADFSRS